MTLKRTRQGWIFTIRGRRVHVIVNRVPAPKPLPPAAQPPQEHKP